MMVPESYDPSKSVSVPTTGGDNQTVDKSAGQQTPTRPIAPKTDDSDKNKFKEIFQMLFINIG